MTSPIDKLQRYTFERAGDGYQFTTTDDGLWVMAKDVERLERELAEAHREIQKICQQQADADAERDALKSAMTQTQHRYAAPFNMHGKETEWVQTRFVAREHIKDKPTEANPSPIRVILLGELERAQPHAMAFGRDGVSDEVNVAHDRALGKGSRNK